MNAKVRIPGLFFAGSRQPTAAPEAEALPVASSFHRALTEVAEDWVINPTDRAATLSLPPSACDLERPDAGMVGRAWSWMHRKYVQTATKRLRVAETVSLGEKRFVALIWVEGREFLIGGGPSGVSLLAQLGKAPDSADRPRTPFVAQGDAE